MLVVVELCTLSFRMDNLSKADIVATALFGDGAAACVLRTGEGGFARIKGAAEHTWPDTLNIMGWRVGDTGFGVIFDRAIPPFAKNHLRPAMEEMLAAQGLHIDDVDSMSWIGPDARACRRNRSWLHRQHRDAERNLILSVVILSLVTAQRLGELVLARRNTRRLLARGAVETSAGHYPFIVALHAAWLIGLWLLAWDRPLNLWLLAVFIGLQAAGAWVIASLGERWTTRIIILPDKPLVRRGPYRLVSHPNYLVVAAEISVLPLAFGLVWFALIFSLLNVAMMAVRISSEAEALRAS